MQNMYSIYNPQYHREQLANAYSQYMNSLYPQQQQNNVPIGYSVFPVSNIEEANATKADLNYNPTFFYNQSKSEIYLKQLDRMTGAATMRYFKEINQPAIEQVQPTQNENISQYSQQLNTILEGINGLYRILNQPKEDIAVSKIEVTKGAKNAK